MQGTNTGHEDGEAMASVGVRLTAQLGRGGCVRSSWVLTLLPPLEADAASTQGTRPAIRIHQGQSFLLRQLYARRLCVAAGRRS